MLASALCADVQEKMWTTCYCILMWMHDYGVSGLARGVPYNMLKMNMVR